MGLIDIASGVVPSTIILNRPFAEPLLVYDNEHTLCWSWSAGIFKEKAKNEIAYLFRFGRNRR